MKSFEAVVRNRGFTIIQLVIAMLVTSALGLGMANYLRKQNATMRSSDIAEEVRSSAQEVQLLLSKDLSHVAFINPLCTENAPPSGASPSIACSSIIIRGGILPLPGADQADIAAMTEFTPTANLFELPAELTKINDGLRLVLFDFSSVFNCRLSARHGSANPSRTSESLWIDPDCVANLSVGKLYGLFQSFSAPPIAYGNVFQPTAISTAQTVTVQGLTGSFTEYQVDMASTGNKFNQVGGLGISGYTDTARIFPVKIVDWAIGSSGGLYRREISPSASDLVGYGAWKLVHRTVESMQINPVTVTTSGVVEHNRTLFAMLDPDDANFGDPNSNGIEDIRGVQVHAVVKGDRPVADGRTFTNVHQSSSTADAYPRGELKFFVAMKNFD